MLALSGLLLAAFLAATPLPMNSEIPFLALLASGGSFLGAVIFASIGNILGSCVTYAMGWQIERWRDSRWFPLKGDHLNKAQKWFARWGRWTLLLSWAPAGDLIVALAGLMRVPFWQFLILMSVAKIARYVVLALVASGLISLF